MALVCLIGRHGSGKSTIGEALADCGFVHISVGLLRRLALASQFPADIPATLMMAMRRARPGSPLAPDIAGKLIKYATGIPTCVIDGFPASAAHIDLLPSNTIFCLVWSPRHVRERRLRDRSSTTKRIWTPGRHSEREQSLAELVVRARTRGTVLFLANREHGTAPIQKIASTVVERMNR